MNHRHHKTAERPPDFQKQPRGKVYERKTGFLLNAAPRTSEAQGRFQPNIKAVN